MENLQFRLEDFFPIYTREDDDEAENLYNSIVLKKEFDICLIISHIEKIKNMNNSILNVKRDENGYSKII